MDTVFITTNNKQLLGAKLGEFAIKKHLKRPNAVAVRLINVDELDVFKAFAGTTFRRRGETRRFDPDDLQSFTLARLMPPELSGYTGRAAVIDPDVFALADVAELFAFDLAGHALAAPKKANGQWETSVMLLDCAKLRHWSISHTLEQLAQGTVAYDEVMRLTNEKNIIPLPWQWDSFDAIAPDTKMLHTTRRLTQPWRTGLPIDFTRAPLPKLFGIIPREPIERLLGRRPARYLPHPDPAVERFFFTLLAEALAAGAVSHSWLEAEVRAGHARPDLFTTLARYVPGTTP